LASTKTFEAQDWLVRLVAHIPDMGDQMVRCFMSESKEAIRWPAVESACVLGLLQN